MPRGQPQTPATKGLTPPARRTRSARKKRQSVETTKQVEETPQAGVPETPTVEPIIEEETPVSIEVNDVPVQTPKIRSARKRAKAPLPPLPDTPVPPPKPSARKSRKNSNASEASMNEEEEAPVSRRKRKNSVDQLCDMKKDTSPKKRVKNQMAVRVHRFRSAGYVPKSILRLCAPPMDAEGNDFAQIAVSRNGGAVELVSVEQKWRCVSVVEGLRSRNVEAMAWISGASTEDAEDSNIDQQQEAFLNIEQKVAAQKQDKRRLFGGSPDGTLFEIDFKTKRQLGVIGSGGGAVFCMTSLCYSNLIAAGCEDGSVRIYRAKEVAKGDIDQSRLELVSTLPTIGDAVLSIAWLRGSGTNGMEGSIVYVGSSDGTIRKFQCASASNKARVTGSIVPHAVSTGTVLLNDKSSFSSLQWKAGPRMTVESRGRKVSTKIWALNVLDDGTVVSGDSMGNVQIWDGNACTLLQSFEHNQNNADVLDVAVSLNQNKIMASGVDSKVICIERVPSNSCAESKWVFTCQQRCHTHDVHSLAIVTRSDSTGCIQNGKKRELLCSAGVDTKICSYLVANLKKYRPKIVYKYPTRAPIALAKGPRILSVMKSDEIEFFQLATSIQSRSSEKNIALDENQAFLGTLGIKSNNNLVSFDVNDEGDLLAVSHAEGLLIFKLDYTEDSDRKNKVLVPKKLPVPHNVNVGCSALKFGNGFLLCATTNGPIHMIRLNRDEKKIVASLEHSFDRESQYKSEEYQINEIVLSPDGKWFATSRNTFGKGAIHVYSLNNQKLWWTLPSTEAGQSSINFLGGINDSASVLAVACDNGAFYLFDVEEKGLNDWSGDIGIPVAPKLPSEINACNESPDYLTFNPASPNKFVMVSLSIILFRGLHGYISVRSTFPLDAVCHPCNINIKRKYNSSNLMIFESL